MSILETEMQLLENLRFILKQNKAVTYDTLAKSIRTAPVRIGRILKDTQIEELKKLSPFVLAHYHHYYYIRTSGQEYEHQLSTLQSHNIPVVNLEAIGIGKVERLIRKQFGETLYSEKILVPESFIWLGDELSRTAS